jgi:hypothetical protein
MSIIRLLVFGLFLCGCNAIFALPDSHGLNDETASYVSSDQAREQSNNYSHAVVLRSLNSLFVDGNDRPEVVFDFLKNDDQWLCAHTNQVALLYIAFSETIDLNIKSFSITYPFHSFP